LIVIARSEFQPINVLGIKLMLDKFKHILVPPPPPGRVEDSEKMENAFLKAQSTSKNSILILKYVIMCCILGDLFKFCERRESGECFQDEAITKKRIVSHLLFLKNSKRREAFLLF